MRARAQVVLYHHLSGVSIRTCPLNELVWGVVSMLFDSEASSAGGRA